MICSHVHHVVLQPIISWRWSDSIPVLFVPVGCRIQVSVCHRQVAWTDAIISNADLTIF